jgi:hypothetical protein
MIWAALFVLASGAVAQSDPVPSRGVEIAGARVTVQILQPVVIRQTTGFEKDADSPRAQVTRRGREVLIEFE